MNVDREILNNRTHARYLISENINKNVDVDLKKGIDIYIQVCPFNLVNNISQLLR